MFPPLKHAKCAFRVSCDRNNGRTSQSSRYLIEFVRVQFSAFAASTASFASYFFTAIVSLLFVQVSVVRESGVSGPPGRVPVAVESASRLSSQSLFSPSPFFLEDLELPFSGGLSK